MAAVLWSSILLSGVFVPVAAQTPARRAELIRIRAELTAADVKIAAHRVARLTPTAGDCERPTEGLHYGLALWRLGHLTGERDDLDHAHECFTRILSDEPDWPWAWYGLGLARLELSRIGAIARAGPLQPVGFSYARGAAAAFIRALELDPAFAAAAEALPQALALERRWDHYDEANAALRLTAGTAAGQVPGVLLGRLRIEREQQERDSALALARRYLDAGGDSGVGYLELAQELFFQGDSVEAARAYWAGLRHARSDSARALYRRQLAAIAAPEELQPYDSLPADSLLPWVRRFWARRDAAAALPPGSRLAEHFRRYEYAVANFRLPVRRPAGTPLPDLLARTAAIGATALATGDLLTTEDLWDRVIDDRLLTDEAVLLAARAAVDENLLDTRGTMYLRHGPPDDRAGRWWLYKRSGRDLIVEVVPPQSNATRPGDRCNLAVKYCFSNISLMERQRRKREEVDMMRLALTTDGQAPRYEEPFVPIVQVYGLHRSRGGSGRILVVISVPGDQLAVEQPDSAAQRLRYPLHLHVVAGTPSGSARFDLDTLRTFSAEHQLDDGEHLSAYVELPLPAGTYNVRVVLEQPDSLVGVEADRDSATGFAPVIAAERGAVVGLDGVRVPESGASLALSDVILGRQRSGLIWWTGTERIPLNPLNAFEAGGTAELYYQASGLTPGVEYRTRLTLRQRGETDRADQADRTDEKAKVEPEPPLVALSFTERATATRQSFRRTLGLAGVEPGTYELELVLESATGTERARRVSVLNVVDQ